MGLPEVLLGLGELARVGFGYPLPRVIEVAAVAGRVFPRLVIGIGVVQRITHIPVNGAYLELLQPLDEAQRRSGVAGKHINAVGLAAGIAEYRGDTSRIGAVARLVVLAQIAQTGARPVLAGGHQRGGQQTQHQRGGQRDRGSSFHPFHYIHPAFITYW